MINLPGKMTLERKAFIDGLLAHYQPEDANDLQKMLKDPFRSSKNK